MSKKTRSRHGAAPRKQAAQELLHERMLGTVWAGIAAGDPLRAELDVAACMALPRVLQMDRDEVENFSATVLVHGAIENWAPEGTALLRLLMSLGTPRVKRAAGAALEEMTGAGIYPPDWVNQVGKPVPVQATRRYDVFGDDEAVALTFRYGETEHGILVQVNLTGRPVAAIIAVAADPAPMMEAFLRQDDPFDRTEPIGLADARRRLEVPLARCDDEPWEFLDPSVQTLAGLPIARARMRRLPADAPPVPGATAADRAAVVDEFMASPLAAEAVAADPGATRFWAELFTGYNHRTSGAPPTQIGPRRLDRIVLRHVPITVMLSPEQRRHLAPAITAWTRWSAGRQGLDEAAIARLDGALTEVLAGFDEAYDNPGNTVGREGLAAFPGRRGNLPAARSVSRPSLRSRPSLGSGPSLRSGGGP